MTEAVHFIHSDLEEVTVKIQVREYLRQFYESFGFKSISETYIEDNIPQIDMILKS